MNLHNDRTLFDGDIDTGTRGKKQGNKDTIIYKFIADFRLSFIYIDFLYQLFFSFPFLFQFYSYSIDSPTKYLHTSTSSSIPSYLLIKVSTRLSPFLLKSSWKTIIFLSAIILER